MRIRVKSDTRTTDWPLIPDRLRLIPHASYGCAWQLARISRLLLCRRSAHWLTICCLPHQYCSCCRRLTMANLERKLLSVKNAYQVELPTHWCIENEPVRVIVVCTERMKGNERDPGDQRRRRRRRRRQRWQHRTGDKKGKRKKKKGKRRKEEEHY